MSLSANAQIRHYLWGIGGINQVNSWFMCVHLCASVSPNVETVFHTGQLNKGLDGVVWRVFLFLSLLTIWWLHLLGSSTTLFSQFWLMATFIICRRTELVFAPESRDPQTRGRQITQCIGRPTQGYLSPQSRTTRIKQVWTCYDSVFLLEINIRN